MPVRDTLALEDKVRLEIQSRRGTKQKGTLQTEMQPSRQPDVRSNSCFRFLAYRTVKWNT